LRQASKEEKRYDFLKKRTNEFSEAQRRHIDQTTALVTQYSHGSASEQRAASAQEEGSGAEQPAAATQESYAAAGISETSSTAGLRAARVPVDSGLQRAQSHTNQEAASGEPPDKKLKSSHSSTLPAEPRAASEPTREAASGEPPGKNMAIRGCKVRELLGASDIVHLLKATSSDAHPAEHGQAFADSEEFLKFKVVDQ
jgi:hypothetical protein